MSERETAQSSWTIGEWSAYTSQAERLALVLSIEIESGKIRGEPYRYRSHNQDRDCVILTPQSLANYI